MPTLGFSHWPYTRVPTRQDNRPAGRSRIGRGFHPKKVR